MFQRETVSQYKLKHTGGDTMNLIAYKTDTYKVIKKDEALHNPLIKQEIEQSEFAKEFKDSQAVVSYFSAHFYDSHIMGDVIQQLANAK